MWIDIVDDQLCSSKRHRHSTEDSSHDRCNCPELCFKTVSQHGVEQWERCEENRIDVSAASNYADCTEATLKPWKDDEQPGCLCDADDQEEERDLLGSEAET